MFLPYVQSHVKATSDVVEVFDSTSRYLDELLNINHPINTKQKIYILIILILYRCLARCLSLTWPTVAELDVFLSSD